MICLHRLRGQEFWINHRHIEYLEKKPDTVITLINEHRYVVKETPEEICDLVRVFEGRIYSDPFSALSSHSQKTDSETNSKGGKTSH